MILLPIFQETESHLTFVSQTKGINVDYLSCLHSTLKKCQTHQAQRYCFLRLSKNCPVTYKNIDCLSLKHLMYFLFLCWYTWAQMFAQSACDLNLVMISSLTSKCQDFKVEMPFFQPLYVMKLKISKFKVLAFCCQWRYHYQIQITRSLYHKNQILKC